MYEEYIIINITELMNLCCLENFFKDKCNRHYVIFFILFSFLFSLLFSLVDVSCFMLWFFWVILCSLRMLLKLLYWVFIAGFNLLIMMASLIYRRFLSSSLFIILVLFSNKFRLIFVLRWSDRCCFQSKKLINK